MPDERGKPRWELFEEIFGVMPPPEAADPCTVTFSWLTTMFGVLPENASEVQVPRHTQAYIMLLLSTQLFEDKTAARVPEPLPSIQQERGRHRRVIAAPTELDILEISCPQTIWF
ncbi:hypothetical protein PIB30_031755 [Stylosanthes scabra]|uniref:Uncharacterized protein n=1 Tax=Stylosanthes scabra TaxID=79078 RepID=A0ABU6VBS1_9FABA|nr:hypothetical protein [Stylosanthes scabra]